MAKDIKIGKWSSNPGDIYGNVDGGLPLVVFNSAMDTALVLSPATTFMSANQYSFKDDQTGETVLTFGPMSSIDEVNNCFEGRLYEYSFHYSNFCRFQPGTSTVLFLWPVIM